MQLYQLLTASNQRISWAKTLNKINLTCMFNNWCHGATDKAMTLHVNGQGFGSRRGKFFFFLVILFLFSLFCFVFTIFYLLVGFNLVILLVLTVALCGIMC